MPFCLFSKLPLCLRRLLFYFRCSAANCIERFHSFMSQFDILFLKYRECNLFIEDCVRLVNPFSKRNVSCGRTLPERPKLQIDGFGE